MDVSDLGDADELLKNHRSVDELVHQLLKRGITPSEEGWGGWLGRYQTALRDAALQIQNGENGDPARVLDRRRHRSHDHGR